MTEHTSSSYSPRTRLNVRDSDATLIVGRMYSAGSALTAKYCDEMGKPFFCVPFPDQYEKFLWVPKFRSWLLDEPLFSKPVEVLNVAGNRESHNPGIHKFTYDFLIHTIGPMVLNQPPTYHFKQPNAQILPSKDTCIHGNVVPCPTCSTLETKLSLEG